MRYPQYSILYNAKQKTQKLTKTNHILFVPELGCMHGYLFEVEFSGLHGLIRVCTLILLAEKFGSAC